MPPPRTGSVEPFKGAIANNATGQITATAGRVRETAHDLPGGVEVDVSVTLPEGRSLEMAVTLHPAKAGGIDCTLWIPNEATLTMLRGLSKRARRQVEEAIEFSARRAATDAGKP